MADPQDTDIINKKIINYIPEFSGTNSDNIIADLQKFLNCAEWLYNQIPQADRDTFNQLIKFRLKGEAFQEIVKRDIPDYPALRNTLNNMYSVVASLDELQKKCFSAKQKYYETTKSFGLRLQELLDEYKNGFQTKYNQAPDNATTQLLNEQAINTFRRGLNNTILKEKISTVTADNLEEIIQQTIRTEKLIIASETVYPDQDPDIQYPPPKQPTPTYPVQTKIICNYCNKPGHSWADCRTRIWTENKTAKYQDQYTNRPYQPELYQPRLYQTQTQPTPQYQPLTFNKFYQAPTNKYPPTKTCTFCMRHGHDITECRTKMFKDREQQHQTHLTTMYQPYNNVTKIEPPYYSQNQPNIWEQRQQNRQIPQPRPPIVNENNNYGFEICNYCKKPGHKLANCNIRRNNYPNDQIHTQQNDSLENQFAEKLKIFHIQRMDQEVEHYPPENYQGSDER